MPRGRTSNASSTPKPRSNATRKNTRFADSVDSRHEDNELLGSQDSNGGSEDGSVLQFTFAERYIAEKEKKGKERRRQFIGEVRKGLLMDLNEMTAASNNTLKPLDQAYDNFVLQHAALSDRIRKLWVAIQDERAGFAQTLDRKKQEMTARDGQREKSMIGALGKVREGCEGLEAVVKALQEDAGVSRDG